MVRPLFTGGKNPEIARGIRAKPSKGEDNAALRQRKAKEAREAKAKAPKTKVIKRNGKEYTVPVHTTRKWYPVEPTRRRRAPKKQRKETLRKSITPGTVLIILSGKFRGKRCVFLKQLDSGLLLVTGPFKLNGVPLRRVQQAYVIATSTKVDVSGVKLNDKLDDNLFKAPPKKPQEALAQSVFFNKKRREKTPLSDERKALQKEVDEQLLPIIEKVELLPSYLSSLFTLTNGQYPHQMKF